LGSLLQESELELLHFQNQVAKGGQGVPDAVISSSCRVLIETKVERNSVSLDQLSRHLERLKGQEVFQRLLVLTPDVNRPEAISKLPDTTRVAWASFEMLDQAIDDLLKDPKEVVAEKEAFLLRNIQLMLEEEDLLKSPDEVVVVPARVAWPEYLRVGAYVCQPKRPFRRVEHIAFYADGAIQPKVPQILEVIDEVVFDPDSPGVSQELGKVIQELIKEGARERGEQYKVFMLSPPTDWRTLALPGPVVNDLTSETGRGVAFTQSQRYVSLSRLRIARHTSEL
jgi:hypothetical protein